MKRTYIKKFSSQDLDDGALAFTTDFVGAFRLCQVILRFAATVTETVTTSLDAAQGAEYDAPLDSSNLSSAQTYIFRPTGEAIFCTGDQIKVACTKATATCLCYAQVIVEDLGKN